MTGLELIKNFHKNIFIYDYHSIREEFAEIFISQCGNLKYEDIKKRINSSNTFNKMINNSRLNKTYVNEKSIIGALLTIPHFMFKDGYTQFLASLFALERWNQEVNRYTNVQTEEDVKFVSIEMFLYIDRTKGFRV